ncbi:hypothetical protein R2G56_20805 [Nitratireductor aquimarinus]|uniref:Uncharacterized protein n=1 Tax=Nitratireductor aquimarinus TaxID=889300 RepID=A0ABU4AR60_9HYPH|nr:hypothetical protein [Nitratireductor aquimarinus]MDV6228735.1 hypothetical protein [Nitratireductor aquimarinus]
MSAPQMIGANNDEAMPLRCGHLRSFCWQQAYIVAVIMSAASFPLLLGRSKKRRRRFPAKARLRGIATVPGWFPAS